MITAEEILNGKENRMISVSPGIPVNEVLELMNQMNIGAMMVVENDTIVGIWTERDLVDDFLRDDFDLQSSLVGDFMSTGLQSVRHDDNVFVMMDTFLGKKMRHLLVEKDGRYLGVISSGDVMRATMYEKDKELRRLNAMVDWNHYEKWK